MLSLPQRACTTLGEDGSDFLTLSANIPLVSGFSDRGVGSLPGSPTDRLGETGHPPHLCASRFLIQKAGAAKLAQAAGRSHSRSQTKKHLWAALRRGTTGRSARDLPARSQQHPLKGEYVPVLGRQQTLNAFHVRSRGLTHATSLFREHAAAC